MSRDIIRLLRPPGIVIPAMNGASLVRVAQKLTFVSGELLNLQECPGVRNLQIQSRAIPRFFRQF